MLSLYFLSQEDRRDEVENEGGGGGREGEWWRGERGEKETTGEHCEQPMSKPLLGWKGKSNLYNKQIWSCWIDLIFMARTDAVGNTGK